MLAAATYRTTDIYHVRQHEEEKLGWRWAAKWLALATAGRLKQLKQLANMKFRVCSKADRLIVCWSVTWCILYYDAKYVLLKSDKGGRAQRDHCSSAVFAEHRTDLKLAESQTLVNPIETLHPVIK